MSSTPTVPQAELTYERVPLRVGRQQDGKSKWCHACDKPVNPDAVGLTVDVGLELEHYNYEDGERQTLECNDTFGVRLCVEHARQLMRDLLREMARLDGEPQWGTGWMEERPCKRCGEAGIILDGICGSCADDLRGERQAEEAVA